MDPVYKRVVLKISGEALAGEKHTGFDFDFVSKVCATVKKCAEMGVEVGIVIGGGAASRTARARSSASAPTGWVCLQPA